MSKTSQDDTAQSEIGRQDMRVLLIDNPEDQRELTCSEKMSQCWVSFKEKLGC